jgi:transcriptional regulator with XRE-family HTH domain
MKQEARNEAQRIFFSANAKVSNVEIAKKLRVDPRTVAKWKREDDWESKFSRIQAGDGSEKIRSRPLKKKGAHDQALSLYLEASGEMSNRTLAKRVGVSVQTISNWKLAESWSEKLRESPKSEPIEIGELKAPPELPSVREPEEADEIQIDVDEVAYPEHVTLLNKRIDQILGQKHLSPTDLKTVAEAKIAVLHAVRAYVEVLERALEE